MQMTRNILRTFRAATPEQYEAGINWYAERNAFVRTLTDDVWLGAGLLAAYSPLTPWWRNLELAEDSLRTGVARTDTLPNNYKAAARMLAGEHPLDVLGGIKTRHFTENIATAGVSELVTVDSIAYSAALNKHTTAKKTGMGIRQYREIAACYTRAAEIEGIEYAPQMQAVVWVVWRDAHPNKAAVRGAGQ
jgi:hypothetical protein